MEIENAKSLADISDRQLLESLLASNLHILRKLDFIDEKVSSAENSSYTFEETLHEMMTKIPTLIKRIDQHLNTGE